MSRSEMSVRVHPVVYAQHEPELKGWKSPL